MASRCREELVILSSSLNMEELLFLPTSCFFSQQTDVVVRPSDCCLRTAGRFKLLQEGKVSETFFLYKNKHLFNFLFVLES